MIFSENRCPLFRIMLYGSALRALSMSAAVTLVVPLPKKPLTKFATAASSSSLWPGAKGGMEACSAGSGALEQAGRIGIRLVGAGWLKGAPQQIAPLRAENPKATLSY